VVGLAFARARERAPCKLTSSDVIVKTVNGIMSPHFCLQYDKQESLLMISTNVYGFERNDGDYTLKSPWNYKSPWN
jgi:hypothetical protein